MPLNPGADDALGVGCKCSPRLNAHGKGAGTNGRGETLWVIAKKCPLHDPEQVEKDAKKKNQRGAA